MHIDILEYTSWTILSILIFYNYNNKHAIKDLSRVYFEMNEN